MPEAMERALRKEARKRWPKDKKRQDTFVYGAMRKRGWKPSGEKTRRKGKSHARRKS